MRKEVTQELYNFLIDINYRHKVLDQVWYWFNLYDLFEENLNTKNGKYWKIISELFYDIHSKRMVNHIYDSNDWLESINKELYTYLNMYSAKVQLNIYKDIMIDYKVIIAQTNSLISRPQDLKSPIEYEKSGFHSINEIKKEYYRIWYYEKQLYSEDKFRDWYKQKTVYWWIIFDESKDFPYSDYKLNIKNLYNYNDSKNIVLEDNPIITHIQSFDMFENYKILWLKNELINLLWLKIGNFNKWLFAVDSKDEIILKFNQWNSEYLWNDVKWMIPSLSWSELLIRGDYFKKLKNIYWKDGNFLIKVIS